LKAFIAHAHATVKLLSEDSMTDSLMVLKILTN